MKYAIVTKFSEKIYSDCLVFGIFENTSLFGFLKKIDYDSNGYINSEIKKNKINGKLNDFLLLHFVPNFFQTKVLLLGCGKKECININIYKKLFKISMSILKKLSIRSVTYFFTDLDIKDINLYWKIRFSISAIQDSLYSFKYFKTLKNSEKNDFVLNKVDFYCSSEDSINLGNNAIKHGLIISKGKEIAKNISNMPPNICDPSYLATQAIKLSQCHSGSIVTDIVNHKDMKNLGMNAYLSVGQGSQNKSLMAVIKYKGTISDQVKNIVLIGKGVTFDSGGISIKPSSHLDEMKFDMSGAAVILGLMTIVSELKLPLNVIGVIAGSENMVGSKAFRPGDILTTMSGKTVEVLNTDAEGRLVLCDALTYVEQFNPEVVIDVATLTGACVVALGHHVTGLLSNNQKLIEDLKKSSEQTGDLVWEMPLFKEYYKSLKSNIADMANVGDNSAGMITAACFLSKFAHKYVWAHLDIAGTAWISGKNKGSTGRPIDLLAQFLLNKLNW